MFEIIRFIFYTGRRTRLGKPAGTSRIGLAYSTDGLHFKRLPKPVLHPDEDDFKKFEWEGGCEDPRIVEDNNGTYYMTYTAYERHYCRSFSLQLQKILLHWKKHGSVFKNASDGAFINYWSKSGSIVCKRNESRLVATKINGKYWMYWGEIKYLCGYIR
ncbi:MAG: hypothetical protein WKF59_02610 [Chitinophagaceae bacterium]